ncbi:MAG: hypothetical protein P1U86_09170 [Verrucomicrobiales bacterium]|nr:hypothetical protein [Verrucomicrobiales bacterium]
MKDTQHKTEQGSARVIVMLIAAAAVGLLVFVGLQFRPATAVAKKQASLIEGIERRSASRIQRLLSEEYSDRWEFTDEEIVEAVVDVGSQFMALVVTAEDQTLEINEDGIAVVTAKLIVSGKPVGPAGQEATKRVNQLKSPFTFTWKKDSFLPTSWRLVKIDNPDLPGELYGYEPGDIGRAMRGE